MTQRIIYKRADGGISVIIPTPEALLTHTIEAIAAKDVPAGFAYKIVPAEDIPSDRSERALWDVDVAELTDGVGSESDEFPVEEE